jgi:syndecan 1
MTADGSDRTFGAPRFDVVLRGYDRRQVDEHLARLQRLMGRMRNDLDAARTPPAAPIGPPTPEGGRPRPTPRPRPDGSPPTGAQDVVGTFTDRMHAILQKAEEEASEIRHKARAAARAEEERAAALRSAARAEEEAARRTLADLVRQRDAVLAELTRVRGQLEGLLSGPTARITLPTQERAERRDPAAGQPLPGTPDPAPAEETVVVATGASVRPVRTTTGTAVFPAPGDPAADVAEPVAPSEPAVAPAEETAFMEPLADASEPAPESTPVEAGAAEPDPEPASVESTQVVEPPGRRPDDGGDDGAPSAVEAPTQIAPARSG